MDSQLIAVGQSDNVVYIFNVGKALEKKAIQGRFALHSAATSICWLRNGDMPAQCDILVGCADGTIYICNLSKKQAQVLCSYQCFAGLLTQKQISPDGQATVSGGQPVQAIHSISGQRSQAVVVSESGLAALYDLEQPGSLKMVARHSQQIAASSLLFPRGQPQKQFLLIADTTQKIVVNSVETGQALTAVSVRAGGVVTSAAMNPSGSGVLLGCPAGLQYVSIQSISPLLIQHDPQASLELQQGAREENTTTITALSWRPDSACVCVGFSNGQLEEIVPSLSAYSYCGAEVTAVAPNKSQLRLRGFNSKANNFPPGVLELTLQKSQEILRLKCSSKAAFSEAVRSGQFAGLDAYLYGVGDRSFTVYSFLSDGLSEIPIQLTSADKVYFDVGVRRILVVASGQMGEFTVVSLLGDAPVVYGTVRQCASPVRQLLSAAPQQGGSVLVAHVGEDRQEFVLTELSPPDEADDFTEPVAVLGRVKLPRAADWMDISPTGRLVLIRDVSGAVYIYAIQQQQLLSISGTLGDGMVLWAAPFDVLVGQEGPDQPVVVYYNPGDAEDVPALLQVPSDQQGWALHSVRNVESSGKAGRVLAGVRNHDGSKELQLELDADLLMFNMLLQQREILGACVLLTRAGCTNRNQWARLAQLGLETKQFMVVSRSFAALGEVGLSRAARKINQRLRDERPRFESDFQFETYQNAQVALLRGNLDDYDRFLQQAGRQQEAIDIYRQLRLYHRAEQVAPEAQKELLYQEAVDWLMQTRQSTLAAQLKAQRGDFRGALELLMQDKAYLAAFELTRKVLEVQSQALSTHVVEALATALEQSGHYLQAGVLARMAPLSDAIRALALFRRGGQYAEALQLARVASQQDCCLIEREWADFLSQTGHFEAAIPHYVEARENRRAVDCCLRAGNYDVAERLLAETQIDNSAELCLRLGEARYLQGETDSAVEQFRKADQTLLALAALTSVGRFEDAIKFVLGAFPQSNAGDVILSEARRLIRIEERRYGHQERGFGVGGNAASILSKMESMSSVHGVLAARDFLSAAGMHEQALELLASYKLWDDLVGYAREHRVRTYASVLERVAGIKRERGDLRGCAQLLAELAVELFKEQGAPGQGGQLRRALEEATAAYNSLNMFEESIQLCRRCNSSEALVQVALKWLTAQSSQFQIIAQQLVKIQKLDQTVLEALNQRMFDVAMQLADFSASPEEQKKEVWLRQGQVFAAEDKLQEAEHSFMTAGRPMEALQMYVSRTKWVEAEQVANNMPMGENKDRAIRAIKEGRALALVQEGRFKDAEQLYADMDQVETMVQHYTDRKMFQEAMKYTSGCDRRDLTVQIQQMMMDGQGMGATQRIQPGAQQHTYDGKLSDKLKDTQKQQQNSQEIIQAAVGLANQLKEACKAGGEAFLGYLLGHAAELAQMIISKTVSEPAISDDLRILGSNLKLSGQESASEKAAYVMLFYVTKGVPSSLLNPSETRGTISPMLGPGARREQICLIIRAVLGLEFPEEDFTKRVLAAELTKDGVYSLARQFLLAYRAGVMATSRGQTEWQKNKFLAIPGDAELSRLFDAVHLVAQSAYTLSQPNTVQALKEKAQILSSLVRYCDVIPVDRAFAMAGLQCKRFYQALAGEGSAQAQQMKKVFGGQAVVFLNRLMDISDLRAGESTGGIEADDLEGSGIPVDCRAPAVKYLGKRQLEETRAFVMQMSVQNSETDAELPRESCPHGCGKERWTGAIACGHCKNASPACAITGLHVVNAHVRSAPQNPSCVVCGCWARPAPWNGFVAKTKSCPVCGDLGNPMGK